MRVLHVLNPWSVGEAHALPKPGGSDAALVLCGAAIQAIPDAEHEVLLIGGSAEARRAASFGVTPNARIAPPLRLRSLARRGVKAWLASGPRPDSILAWDVDPASLGIRHDRGCWINCSGEASCTAGAIPTPRFTTKDRATLRAQLGLAESSFALGLLADPPSRGDTTRLIFLISMLQIIGLPVVGLLHAASHGIRRAMSEIRLAYTVPPPIVSDLSVAEFLPACDAAVVSLGSRFGGHSPAVIASEAMLMALAFQSGVPVVTACLERIPAPLHHACASKSGHPGDVSRALLPLVEDLAFLHRVQAECLRHAPGDAAGFASHVRDLVASGAKVGVAR